ncbi:MAG TPA: aldehyde dehydrogenase family protein [Acidimicrobiia bacterium]|jgi:acyl-CoA reductase-like NAD-dependent aldehyde dehydrogenase
MEVHDPVDQPDTITAAQPVTTNSTTTPELDLRAPPGVFVDGDWKATAGGASFDTICPATGDVIGTVAEATAPDVDLAVRAADAAFAAWSRTTTEQRHDLLVALAERIEADRDRLTLIEVVDTGSTISRMRSDMVNAARLLRMYAGLARQLRGSTIPVGPNTLAYTVREPYGVVAHIVPFNHPLMFAAQAIGAALAAGNTIVLKPSEYTPLSTRELAELARDLFAPGVVNVLTGFGASCGAHLASHPLVRKVFFRGSVPTGRSVAAACASRGVPFELELGGKNPFLVWPDADVPAAVRGAVAGLNLGHQGQSCGSATRLLVHDDVYEDFRDALVDAFAKIKVGFPWEPDADMGAMVSTPQYDRVIGYLDLESTPGARILAGGGPVDDRRLDGGLFVQPTVVEVTDASLPIATEEIFGPVTCLMRWNDEDEVIEQANSLDYGLTASVWSRDLATAHSTARRLEAGVVWVNQHGPRPAGVPIGGRKASGTGKELSLEEVDAYTQEKTVLVALPERGGSGG